MKSQLLGNLGHRIFFIEFKKGIQSYLKIKIVRKNLRTQILRFKTDHYYYRHLIIIHNSLKDVYFPPG